ncbi:MAG: sigma-70 family RNA polymerase sigma factor [Planctomycetia bacterium]|nr:sigma-70 family RNA polymerase sigma factor [Planctomycetia bacterium]
MNSQDDREQSLTAILARVDEGDQRAVQDILPIVYDELRSMATAMFSNERTEHTLQPTALVHEAYLRLASRLNERFRDRRQFFALAAKVMRQVLTDHARAARAEKRGRDWTRVTLNPVVTPLSTCDVDIEALDAAMRKLAALNARHAQIVEYRFLSGFTVEEVADLINVSTRTVELDWRAARAWLRLELGESNS